MLDGRYVSQVTKTFPLSNLAKMEVYQGEPGLLANIQILELTLVAGNTETHLTFQTPDESMLLQILAPLWHFAQYVLAISCPHNHVLAYSPQFAAEQGVKARVHACRKFPPSEQKRPGLVTYPNNTVSLVVQLEAWNANHLDPDVERASLTANIMRHAPHLCS